MASPTKTSPRVAVAPSYERSSRQSRRPQHPFNIINLPYLITPVMMAPVLPGETLTSLLIQAQTWSDPLETVLKNTGWWLEYNVWYVKHRDLTGYEVASDGLGKDLIDMFVTNESLASHASATFLPKWGLPIGGVNYMANALQRIVEEYFRDEGEVWSAAQYLGTTVALQGMMKAQIYGRGRDDAFKKLTLASAYEDHRQKLDADNDGTIYVGDEMNRAFNEWAAAHDAGLMDMTYEDWMRTYGGVAKNVDPDRVDYHKPEDIAYHREFTYPTNTVEPSTGVPAVAVGWRTANQIRKKYRFEEPGWIIVTQTIRPKVYLKNQEGLVASMMINRNSWLPAVLNDETTAGHAVIDDLEGPLATVMGVDYMINFRDLLLYGEQFVNYAATGPAFVNLPAADAQRRYADDTAINAFFKTPASGNFKTDGMISLNIMGRQRETTQNLKLYRA